MNRREFLASSVGAASCGLCWGKSSPAGAAGIAEVELDLDKIHKWDDSNGDTWDPFWADDGKLYSFNCDGRGFGHTAQNLAFNEFDGSSFDTLSGSRVNSMSEYGPANLHGADNATWKVCGQECIDGVFYAFVSRNVYGSESHDPLMRQTAFNSSLIKSTDRGLSWVRAAAENYQSPMWAGPAFGAPCFVHYGKNGGSAQVDGASKFVYAVSTNGFWNDGDSLVLGRVARGAIAKLNAGDWEYCADGDAWSKDIRSAKPILELATKLGQTPVCYVAALRRYLLISWYNPTRLTKWFDPTEMRYDFYQAEHPWGPWSLVTSVSDRFLAAGSHMYGPSICAKYQEEAGSEVRVHMFTSGCQFEDKPSGIYKAWSTPLILRTTRRAESEVIPVSGGEIQFTGSGFDCIAGKAAGFGDLDLVLDGKPLGRVKLGLTNFPALSGVTVYRSGPLSYGEHRLSVMRVGNGPAELESVRVYRGGLAS